MRIDGRAHYLETARAEPQAVAIVLDLTGLAIALPDGTPVTHWPFGRIRSEHAPRGALHFSAGGADRIAITEPESLATFAAALRAVPRASEPAIPTSWLGGIALVLLLLAGMVGAILWAIETTAEVLAPLIPESAVTALDAAALPSVLSGIGTTAEARCTAEAGQKALDALTARLADAGSARDMRLAAGVWPSSVPNALALPGGSIVITESLLARVDSADALAGVLAHEIGHVHHRHGLGGLLHQGGLMLVMTLVLGDPTGLAETFALAAAGAGYSREAEREADRFSVDAVAAAGGDPKALGPFLVALEAEAGGDGGLALLRSHPFSDERRQAIERQAEDRAPRPGVLISEAEFAALRAICAAAP